MIDTGDRDIIMELGKALMNTGIKLGRGLTIIVEVLLKVSMLKPAQEETIPQYTRPRVNFFVLFRLIFPPLLDFFIYFDINFCYSYRQ